MCRKRYTRSDMQQLLSFSASQPSSLSASQLLSLPAPQPSNLSISEFLSFPAPPASHSVFQYLPVFSLRSFTSSISIATPCAPHSTWHVALLASQRSSLSASQLLNFLAIQPSNVSTSELLSFSALEAHASHSTFQYLITDFFQCVTSQVAYR